VEQLLRDANSLKEVDFSHNRLESSGMGVMVSASNFGISRVLGPGGDLCIKAG
jgi:hypothetical protein